MPPTPASGAHWLNRDRLIQYPRIFLAAYLICALLLVLTAHHGVDPTGHPLGRDFIGFWSASELALSGHPASAYDIPTIVRLQASIMPGMITFNPWIYPPAYLLAVMPLALLPYFVSYLLFMAASFAAYFVVVRKIDAAPHSLALLLAFPGVFLNFLEGQNGFLTAALAGGALLLLEKRPVAAGALIGLMTIKPHLGILWPVALLCGRHWRALISATVSSVLLFGLSIGILGVDTLAAFRRGMEIFAGMAFQDGTVFVKMPSFLAFGYFLGLGRPAAVLLYLAFAVPVAAAVVWVWRSCRNPALRASALTVGSLLATPYVLNYDLAWLALPLTWLASAGMRSGWLRWEREILTAAWLLPLITVPMAELLRQQLAPFVLLALFLAILRRVNAERNPGFRRAGGPRSA